MELSDYLEKEVRTGTDMHEQIFTRTLIDHKEQMVKELRNRGIHCILSPPEEIAISSIDQYFRARIYHITRA